MKKVIVIAGPTASGKTQLSLKLSQFFKAEIINADSVQMLKYFNIGAAKITHLEQKKIKHHLLSINEPEDCYNIYDFQKEARALIKQITLPFIVGGSGLYIKAALFNYEKSSSWKSLTLGDINHVSLSKMLEQIKKKDPNLKIDDKNPRRVLSAFFHLDQEILRSQKKGKNIPLFDILVLYLDIPRLILKERIINRLEMMIKQGFIEEVAFLKHKFPKANFNIIGYREIKAFLEKQISLAKAQRLIIKNTMLYAKRQKTWFKNQITSQLVMIDALHPKLVSQSIQLIQDFLKKGQNYD
ncbi:tRNA (adenosine(37)-N6)-dimethylallyltransferase MiaA [Candidatus Phytoplasma phoenicium]|uniref:tRNA dimethylallyltransferase n=1 Tax=Candidatus Phytoplasma phoenicium TaxID=198422 RepID=A0A0L0MIW2_9MOLU|nr:tRNA (adenosine(37)-N6)-dimethylallyltransferase MiaA [Candidatus Phytoplasma phoenicium]KND62587.1 tRNA dimethylallyltransferase [Candidatus Phytoplasma phoenicium]